MARTFNEVECAEPLGDAEVIRSARSAWEITERGENRVGRYGAWFPAAEAIHLATAEQDAFCLLAFLKAMNGPDSTFIVANKLAESFGWPRPRFASARSKIIAAGYMVTLRAPSRAGGAALYRWRRSTV